MSQWFGIGVLLLFSVAVSLLSQLHGDRFKTRTLPKLDRWQRLESNTRATGEQWVERRYLVVAGGGFRPSRLIEQTRCRRTSDNKIMNVLPERTLQRWWR